MSRILFATGVTGYLGRRFLEALPLEEFPEVYCLSRDGKTGKGRVREHPKAAVVHGDLLEPERYLPFLGNADVVLHMAAVTGKAPREEYYRVNVEGTRRLVEACVACGIRKFLHVSTIAVKFPDDRDYHYGRSKRQAEDIVSGSGLDYAIVRPTMILGKESPIWKNLSGLGRKALAVIPGDGRARIQPVHVDDLVECIMKVIREDLFSGATHEIGGRDIVTIEDFVRKIHRHYFHKDPAVVHVPLSIIVPPLRLAEKAFSSLLPVNAGQFASFRYDGIVDGNPLFDRCRPNLRGAAAIIEDIAGQAEGAGHGDPAKECDAFCRYLIGRAPDDYVLEKYLEANRIRGLSDSGAEDRLGRRLLEVGTRSPAMMKLVDAFAAIFARRSIFRKKMVLLIAILESGRTAGELVGPATGEGKASTWFGLFRQGIGFLASLLLSILVIVPLTLRSKTGPSGSGR